MRQTRLFFCALQFLTRCPIPRFEGFEPDWIARSTPYFPVVGWLVGGVSAGGFGLVSLIYPGFPAAVLAVLIGCLITGALHEDGLADTADGLGGGRTPSTRLAIMKDSRTGVFGAITLWGVLTLKASLLATAAPLSGGLALILAHGGARAFAPLIMAQTPYVGSVDQAKIKPFASPVKSSEAAVALALGLAPMVLFASPLGGLLGVFLAILAVLGVWGTARRLIGGYTGDVLGAAEQAAEVAFLFGFCAFPAGLIRV